MLDVLLKQGVDIQLREVGGSQVLHGLCNSHSPVNVDVRKNANDEIVVLTLLRRSIDSSTTNHNGDCPPYLVAMDCNKQFISLMLLNGARRLSSAGLFRLHKIVEGWRRNDRVCEMVSGNMMRLLNIEREDQSGSLTVRVRTLRVYRKLLCVWCDGDETLDLVLEAEEPTNSALLDITLKPLEHM